MWMAGEFSVKHDDSRSEHWKQIYGGERDSVLQVARTILHRGEGV